jgi:hypothetical protein
METDEEEGQEATVPRLYEDLESYDNVSWLFSESPSVFQIHSLYFYHNRTMRFSRVSSLTCTYFTFCNTL